MNWLDVLYLKAFKRPRPHAVQSSLLKSIAWDPRDNDLFVTFRNGSRYVYHDVPYIRYYSLIQANKHGDSVGEEFSTNIRKGSYTFRRLED